MGRYLLMGALLAMLAALPGCGKNDGNKSAAGKSAAVKIAVASNLAPAQRLVGSTRTAAPDKNVRPLDPSWTNPVHPDPGTGAELDCEIELGIFNCGAMATLAGHAGKPVPKTDVWGAIAVGAGGYWGYASEKASQKEAEDEAVRQCMLSPGAKDCKLVMNVPGYCAALAMGESHWAASGPSAAVNVAEKDAMLSCTDKDCRIETSFCADGKRHTWPANP